MKIGSEAEFLDGIMEYVLVIVPEAELGRKISYIKKDFFDKYKVSGYRFSESRITLVHFRQSESIEKKLIPRLSAISSTLAPFKIELRDFGSLPSHTIHINLVSKLPIQELVRDIKQAQRLMNLDKENKAHFIEEPQIVIAQKLKPWQYEQGWLEYAHLNFTGRFIAESMLLLKRTSDTKTAYQLVKRFDFLHLKTGSKQASLFN